MLLVLGGRCKDDVKRRLGFSGFGMEMIGWKHWRKELAVGHFHFRIPLRHGSLELDARNPVRHRKLQVASRLGIEYKTSRERGVLIGL